MVNILSKNKYISIRKPIIKDSKKYFTWINNRELVEFNSTFKTIKLKEHNKWFSEINRNPSAVYFSIIYSKKILIGSCSLRNIDLKKQEAELQIRIGEKNFMNKGFGVQALMLLLEFGFLNLKLENIYLNVFASNIRAIKAYEKCLFKREKLIENAVLMNGKFKDMYLMRVVKMDFMDLVK